MGPLSGAVHRLQHGAEPLTVPQCFENEEVSATHDLKGPGIKPESVNVMAEMTSTINSVLPLFRLM